MTFHDDVHASFEKQAYGAYQTLFNWLGTISPIDSGLSMRLMKDLEAMATEMEWPLEVWPGSEPPSTDAEEKQKQEER